MMKIDQYTILRFSKTSFSMSFYYQSWLWWENIAIISSLLDLIIEIKNFDKSP